MSDCLAVPGFNIYGPKPGLKPAFFNSVFFEYGGHIHNHSTPDWTHEALGKSKEEVPSIIYSFTIPLRLPELRAVLILGQAKIFLGALLSFRTLRELLMVLGEA